MRRILTILAAIVMAGTFAAAQTAPQTETKAPKAKAQTEKPAKAASARGTIVKSDASSVTIKTAKGAEESFVINSDTKITSAGKNITTADLTAGENASVSYTKAGDQMTATKITVTPKKAPKAKTPKTEKK